VKLGVKMVDSMDVKRVEQMVVCLVERKVD
jgi:hypothetical protein